jgi:putative ABC transport system permease protein
MNALSLALRNLLRNRRRSITTILAMIVGVVAILLFGGYITDIKYGLQTGYVQHGGHLQIQHKDYFLFGSGNPAAYGILDYNHIIEVLKQDPILAPLLSVATPTLQIGGIAGNFSAAVSRTIYASGTVVSDQNQMLKWNEYRFRAGRDESALTGTSPDSAVIGTGVARVLQLCGSLNVPNCPGAPLNTGFADGAALPSDVAALTAVGPRETGADASNRIEILAANVHGAPNVAAVKVVRAVYQGVKEFDDVFVGLHLSQAQRLVYGAETPAATAIILQLHRTEDMPAAHARLGQLLATTFKDEPLEIQEFTTLNPFYGQTLAMFAVLFAFIASLIGAIVLFTVGNTMSTAVIERTAEIGTLRAMGLRRSGIRNLFLIEGVMLGVLGAVLGIFTALVIAGLINHGGLTWIPPGRVEPVPLTVRVWGESRLLLSSAIGLVIVAALSATWPAARAARLNIVDALRHV